MLWLKVRRQHIWLCKEWAAHALELLDTFPLLSLQVSEGGARVPVVGPSSCLGQAHFLEKQPLSVLRLPSTLP